MSSNSLAFSSRPRAGLATVYQYAEWENQQQQQQQQQKEGLDVLRYYFSIAPAQRACNLKGRVRGIQSPRWRKPIRAINSRMTITWLWWTCDAPGISSVARTIRLMCESTITIPKFHLTRGFLEGLDAFRFNLNKIGKFSTQELCMVHNKIWISSKQPMVFTIIIGLCQ